MRFGGHEGGRDRGSLWEPATLSRGLGQSFSGEAGAALEGGRDEVGSWWVRGKRQDRKGVARLTRGGLEWSRVDAKQIKRWLFLPVDGMPVSGVPLPKLDTQTVGRR